MSSLDSIASFKIFPYIIDKQWRPRRNFSSLLGLNYQTPKEDIPFPHVEQDFTIYDGFYLRDCLRFVKQRLTHRKVIPYTEKLLRLYKSTLIEALTTEDRADRKEAIFSLRYYGHIINSQFWLHGHFPCLEPLILNILAFRELQYRNRYSEFLQAKEDEFSYYKDSHSKTGHEGLPAHRYRFEMTLSLLEEMKISKEWNLNLKQPNYNKHSLTPHHDRIDTACFALGLDSAEMRCAIIEYALDPNAFKNDISGHIARCRWTMLGDLLYHDIKELKCWVPADRKQDYRRVLAVIEGIRDEWLDKAGSPNEKAKKHTEEYNKTGAAKGN